MKFPITLMGFVLAGLMLLIAQPMTAEMGVHSPIQQEQIKTGKKLSFKERIAKRLIEKRLKRAAKKAAKKAKKQGKASPNQLNLDRGGLIQIILAALLVVLLIALIGVILPSLVNILTVVLLVILILYVARLFL